MKRKVNSTQTQLDMHEMEDVLTKFDKVKSRAFEAEKLVQQY